MKAQHIPEVLKVFCQVIRIAGMFLPVFRFFLEFPCLFCRVHAGLDWASNLSKDWTENCPIVFLISIKYVIYTQ